MAIAVIPARGGSKRIPRKNIRFFAGRPMMSYAIEAARSSGLFDHIVVSTDDAEIADIALERGAEVPFIRPNNLSDDLTPTVPVIAHAIRALSDLGMEVGLVCCIYPGVPFLKPSDLHGTLTLLNQSGADYSFPVAEFPSPVQRALVRNERGYMSPLFHESELARTQDLERVYHDAGQFYWGRRAAWLGNERIHSSGVGYPVPNWRVVDIDTEEDWIRAQILFEYMRSEPTHG